MRVFVLSILIVSASFNASEVRAGAFGEHKKIGDLAMKRWLADSNNKIGKMLSDLQFSFISDVNSNEYKIPVTSANTFVNTSDYQGNLVVFTLASGEVVTYGDLCALGGDHSFDPYALIYVLAGAPDRIEQIPGLGWLQGQNHDIVDQLKNEWENLNCNGRGVNFTTGGFINLASEDRSHFMIPAAEMRRQIAWISPGLARSMLETNFLESMYDDPFTGLDVFGVSTGGKPLVPVMKKILYEGLRRNFSLLTAMKVPSPARYAIMSKAAHVAWIYALERYRKMKPRGVLDETARTQARQYALLALVYNAFADHYLQDMFASGHHFVDQLLDDTQISLNSGEPDLIELLTRLEDKGRHDYYGAHGVNVLVGSEPVELHGDGRYSEQQVQLASAANYRSLCELKYDDRSKARTTPINFFNQLADQQSSIDSLAPALAFVPKPVTGIDYELQNTLGRSISGLFSRFTVGAIKTNDDVGGFVRASYGLSFTLNQAVATSSFHESWIAAELLGNLETGRDIGGAFLTPSLNLGFSIADVIYAGAAIGGRVCDGEPLNPEPHTVVLLSMRFEGGIQVKPISWEAGVRLGGSYQMVAGIPNRFTMDMSFSFY